MKDISVEEGNKLIAEFDGKKYYPVKAGYEAKSSYNFIDQDFSTERECFVFCQELNASLKHPDEMWFALPHVNGHEWKYNSSWDLLRPVIDKIFQFALAYPEQIEPIWSMKLVVKIEVAWGRAVQFIIWYNENQKANTL
jgi:hypothetical protein